MSNHKIKDLGIKLLVAWMKKGAKGDCSTNLGFFSLTAQSFNHCLKALFCSLLSFSLTIRQLFILCGLSVFRLFCLGIFPIYAPTPKAKKSTDDDNER